MSSSHGPSAERDSKRKRYNSKQQSILIKLFRKPGYLVDLLAHNASTSFRLEARGGRRRPAEALDQKVMQLQHRIGGIQHFDWLVQINPDPHSRRQDHIKLLEDAVLKLQNRLAGVENLASEMNSNSDSKSKQAGQSDQSSCRSLEAVNILAPRMIRIEHRLMQIEQRFDTFQQRINEQFERLERQLGVPKSSATIMREVKEEHARFEEARARLADQSQQATSTT
ncbi:hypothetical protein PSTT_06519 [Puccinia striiformis]|uniref:Uncharacterized protein n=1 Tax=Puccinia striiformis TaxID=27350 RepID=A0A2S4VKK9_9BASI|nr:hypothetical protein PSTT_06519 [Puccinia striiformis]